MDLIRCVWSPIRKYQSGLKRDSWGALFGSRSSVTNALAEAQFAPAAAREEGFWSIRGSAQRRDTEGVENVKVERGGKWDKDAEYFSGVKWPVDSSDKVELRLGWRFGRMISCANPVSEVWMGSLCGLQSGSLTA